jgi:addiction module RelB/DinJ family antitoxin
MNNMASIAIRLDHRLKKSANEVAKEFGVNLSSVIRDYLSQIVQTKKIPYKKRKVTKFSDIKNPETLEAIKWADDYFKSGKKSPYKNADEMFASLGI